MTPLAQALLNDLCLPVRKRTYRGPPLTPLMTDIHCFEVSAIAELARDQLPRFVDSIQSVELRLPAEKVWLEFKVKKSRGVPHDGRMAALLSQRDDQADVTLFTEQPNELMGSPSFVSLPLGLGGDWSAIVGASKGAGGHALPRGTAHALLLCAAFLTMINAPKSWGRTIHQPHAGLQRKLVRSLGVNGKFPLRAWTEIRLLAGPQIANGRARDGHLSGTKALHFSRGHFAPRWGKMTWISPCWKGDASKGVKRSRYCVVPPRSGGAA